MLHHSPTTHLAFVEAVRNAGRGRTSLISGRGDGEGGVCSREVQGRGEVGAGQVEVQSNVLTWGRRETGRENGLMKTTI